MMSGTSCHSTSMNQDRSHRSRNNSKILMSLTATTWKTTIGPAIFERIQIQAVGKSKWNIRVPCKRLAVRHGGRPGHCEWSRRGCQRMRGMGNMGM